MKTRKNLVNVLSSAVLALGSAGLLAEDDPPMGAATPAAMPMPAPGASMGMDMDMDMMKMQSRKSKRMDQGMMGMGAMGGINNPTPLATPSSLPGFPGQSHLYHIGATDFFLDHPEHVELTAQQQQTLGRRKELAVLTQAEMRRQIDAAEQELWKQTGSAEPSIAAIEKTVRTIERLRADGRLGFIRAVGGAAEILTEAQRQQLTGMAPRPSMPQRRRDAPMAMPEKGAGDPPPAKDSAMPMPSNGMPMSPGADPARKPDSMGHM